MAKLTLRFIFLALAGIAAVLLCLLVFHFGEPRYHGHSASFWFSKLSRGAHKEQIEAQEAFRAMGQSAVPFLIHELEKQDSALKLKILKNYAPRFPFLYSMLPETYDNRRAWAASALGEIGAPASNAIPVLQQMIATRIQFSCAPAAALMKIKGEPIAPLIQSLEDTNSTRWALTASTLGEFGTNAAAAVPALCRGLQSRARPWEAAYPLGFIHSQPEIAVPALMEAAKAPNPRGCIWALGEFEDQARPAIPILRQFLQDRDPDIRLTALMSLQRILPPEDLKSLVPALVQSSRDPNPSLRAVAQYILKEIDPEAAKKATAK